MSKLAKPPWRIAAFPIAALCAEDPVAIGCAAAQPAIDEPKSCFDGAQPCRIGAHLCSSRNSVLIRLRPNQGYGLHGVYVDFGKDRSGLRFEKAHFVDTTSARCDRRGKAYD